MHSANYPALNGEDISLFDVTDGKGRRVPYISDIQLRASGNDLYEAGFAVGDLVQRFHCHKECTLIITRFEQTGDEMWAYCDLYSGFPMYDPVSRKELPHVTEYNARRRLAKTFTAWGSAA